MVSGRLVQVCGRSASLESINTLLSSSLNNRHRRLTNRDVITQSLEHKLLRTLGSLNSLEDVFNKASLDITEVVERSDCAMLGVDRMSDL